MRNERTTNVVDLGLERARRLLPSPALLAALITRIDPPPPPGYRRGDRVLLKWSCGKGSGGEIGTVLSHRWVVGSDRVALRLVVQTPSRTAACAADSVTPLSARGEPPPSTSAQDEPSPRA